MKSLLLNTIIVHIVYGQSRYVIDDDSDLGIFIAAPIDICFQNKFNPLSPPATYLKYTCSSDGSQVYKTEYSDTQCATQTATSVVTFTSGNTSPCGGPKFSCTGSRDTDAYVQTGFYSDTGIACNSQLVTIPFVLGCYCDSASTSYNVDCTDASTGTFLTYTDSTSCATTGLSQDLSQCYIAQASGSTPNINAQIDDCKLSTDTLEPTSAPTATSDAPSSAPTATLAPSESPTVTRVYNSRYIIDDDWALGSNYPFPFDICLQTQPSLDFPKTDPEYVKYVCAGDNNSVTKYKWTVNDVNGLGNGYDCSDISLATFTVIDNTVTDPCSTHNFKCVGEDNYAVATLKAGLSGNSDPNCDNASFDPLLKTAVATEVCFCGSDISGKITCDPTQALTYNYTGTDCMVEQADPSILGQSAKCTHFITVKVDGFLLDIFGVLDECVDNGVDIYQTIDPSSEPTTSPTETTSSPTGAPTSAPTDAPSTSPTAKVVDSANLYSFNACLLFTIFAMTILLIY